jgi:hypothetical protein
VDARFITIVKQIVSEHGKEALIDATKCKAHIDDYLQSGFAKAKSRYCPEANDYRISSIDRVQFFLFKSFRKLNRRLFRDEYFLKF